MMAHHPLSRASSIVAWLGLKKVARVEREAARVEWARVGFTFVCQLARRTAHA